VLHGAEKDYHAENRAANELYLHFAQFRRTRCLNRVNGHIFEFAQKFIAVIFHNFRQSAKARPTLAMKNGGSSRGQIDTDICNTVNIFQRVFHAPHAGRASHAAYRNDRFGVRLLTDIDKRLITQIMHFRLQGLNTGNTVVVSYHCFFRGKIYRDGLHAGHLAQSFLHAPYTGGTGHAANIEPDFIQRHHSPPF